MDSKAAWKGWSRFCSMGCQESRVWDIGARSPRALTLTLGQWWGPWVSRHWRSLKLGSSQRANLSTEQRRQIQIRPVYFWQHTMLLSLALSLLFSHSTAAFIDFENCLPPSTINSNPVQLQFIPLYVYATFNTTAASHSLNITVYGNVSGSANPPQASLPAWNDTQYWTNQSEMAGKILDVSPATNLVSTLFVSFNVLSYTPYAPAATRFANTTIQGQFPLAPVFTPNA